ncbi:MAG: inositol monophosphatase [Actinomycetales bacterium]|nr:MAG: inositol monophosphatase [Actinomycetales bacterium]
MEQDMAYDGAALERIAVALALEAGRLIRDERPIRLATDTKSSNTDVVTDMDTRSEALLHKRIAESCPQDGLLGEEGAHRVGSTGITWVVDPIDGTTNYLYDLPMYAVSVAAVVGSPAGPDWMPIAGAVHAPVLDTVWSAAAGAGARRTVSQRPDPQAIVVGTEHELSRALVATGFGYRAEARARQARLLTRVLPHVRDIRRCGSAAVDLCMVADGRVDAFYESGLRPWDLAAGWLIAREAGAVVTDGAGGHPGEHLVLAANPALHESLGRLVAH